MDFWSNIHLTLHPCIHPSIHPSPPCLLPQEWHFIVITMGTIKKNIYTPLFPFLTRIPSWRTAYFILSPITFYLEKITSPHQLLRLNTFPFLFLFLPVISLISSDCLFFSLSLLSTSVKLWLDQTCNHHESIHIQLKLSTKMAKYSIVVHLCLTETDILIWGRILPRW